MNQTKFRGAALAVVFLFLGLVTTAHTAMPQDGAPDTMDNGGVIIEADMPEAQSESSGRPVQDEPRRAGLLAEDDLVDLNFPNTEIKTVAEAVGMITGKTFILNPRVKGRINLFSSQPVPSDIVYEIFLSALRLQGFAAIEKDGVVKIVNSAEAKQSAEEVFGKNLLTKGDRVVTQVYKLQYESADKLLRILRPLVSKNNTILAYSGSNVLVITDFASNVERMNKIIVKLDRPLGGDVEVIRLKHMSVLDFASIVNRLYMIGGATTSVRRGGGAPGGARSAGQSRRFVMIPNIRINGLIIRSEDPLILDQIKSLKEKLDVPATSEGNIHVIRLKHSKAETMAKILNGVLKSQSRSGGRAPTTPGGQARSGSVSTLVQADKVTNSVIIAAPDNIYNVLMAVLTRLDIRRKQIFVEALIVEVTSDKMAEMGIQWQSLRGFDTTRAPTPTGVGGINIGGTAGSTIGGVTTGDPVTGAGQGFSIGVVNGTITLPSGAVIPNLLALARILETQASANILSTPTLLTVDNEEAKILVGQNVPFITGSYAPNTGGATNTVNPFQTIERRDIGLTLKIKPQITESDTVRIKIYQEISSLLSTSVRTGASDVITNKRSIDSTVLVDDGQIIALGGLMQDKLTVTEKKVPFLGDIPLLGLLFRSETRGTTKTNLMVFLRPHIIRDADDSEYLTSDSYYKALGKQSDVKTWWNPFLPEMPSPQLPKYQRTHKYDKSSTGEIKPEEPATVKNTDTDEFDDDDEEDD